MSGVICLDETTSLLGNWSKVGISLLSVMEQVGVGSSRKEVLDSGRVKSTTDFGDKSVNCSGKRACH